MGPHHHDADRRAGGPAPPRPVARQVIGDARIAADQAAGIPAAPRARTPAADAHLVDRVGPVTGVVTHRVAMAVMRPAHGVTMMRPPDGETVMAAIVADLMLIPMGGGRLIGSLVVVTDGLRGGGHDGQGKRRRANKSEHGNTPYG